LGKVNEIDGEPFWFSLDLLGFWLVMVAKAKEKISQYCANKVPPHVRDQLQITYKIITNEVWIYERRPIRNNPSGWREFPFAKAKFTLKTNS
jgi:hypothetical protein